MVERPKITVREKDFLPFKVDNWLTIHVLNVGQGDCILIQFPEGGERQKMLIVLDHYGTNIEHTRIYIEQYLSFKPGDPIIFIVSHAHQDHIQKMVDLLEYFHPLELFISPLVRIFTMEYFKLINAAFKLHIPVITLYGGMSFHNTHDKLQNIDKNVIIDVISPIDVEQKYAKPENQRFLSKEQKNSYIRDLNELLKRIPKGVITRVKQTQFLTEIDIFNKNNNLFPAIPDEEFDGIEEKIKNTLQLVDNLNASEGGIVNNSSLVLKIEYFGIKILLTGDIEEEGWKTITQSGEIIDILKIPHHGSHQLYAESYIKKIEPKFAFISVDLTNNTYGHPNFSTMTNLTKINSLKVKDLMYRIYRTDDFKHNGPYNDLPTLRNNEGNKNEIILYIFGIIPPIKTGALPFINTYRLYHHDSSRTEANYYSYEGKNSPKKWENMS